MARTLAERARDWRWWGEQGLHALLGAVAAACLAAPSGVDGALVGLILGVTREYEQRPVESWPDAIVDVLAVVLGGAAVGLALGLR